MSSSSRHVVPPPKRGGINYPETLVASSLAKEGMGKPLVQLLLNNGNCKVEKLAPLAGLSARQFAEMTNGVSSDRLNVEYIRRALTKLRVELPPVPVEPSSSSSVVSEASTLTTPGGEGFAALTPPGPGTSSSSSKLPDLPDSSQKSSLTEHERMLLILREFPVAYEQYVRENGGPSLYGASSSGSSIAAGRKKKAPADEAALQHQQGDSQVSALCGVSPDFSLWNMVVDALGFFGFSSKDQTQYETVDQIVDEFCTSTGALTGAKLPFNPSKKKKAKLSAVAAAKDTGNPLLLRPTDWTNREAAGLHLLDESRRLFRIFSGLTRGEGVPTFNWEFRVTKNRVTVHGAIIEHSPWQAVKSDCIIHADKHRIRRLITDDTRSHEYDDQVAGYKLVHTVSDHAAIRHYWFLPIWPTAARDFCMLTSWEELEDGCVMVTSLSAPNEFFAKKPPFVRAYLLSSGALLRPIEAKLGGGTHVTFVTHCDAGGSVPAFVLNILGTGTPIRTMSKVCEIAEKEERAEKASSLAESL